MLTLRRGIARIGWFLLCAWVVVWAAIVIVGRATAVDPPPLDATLVLQVIAFVIGWPLAIFLLWRLLLWISQGFWQSSAVQTDATPKALHSAGRSSACCCPWSTFDFDLPANLIIAHSACQMLTSAVCATGRTRNFEKSCTGRGMLRRLSLEGLGAYRGADVRFRGQSGSDPRRWRLPVLTQAV